METGMQSAGTVTAAAVKVPDTKTPPDATAAVCKIVSSSVDQIESLKQATSILHLPETIPPKPTRSRAPLFRSRALQHESIIPSPDLILPPDPPMPPHACSVTTKHQSSTHTLISPLQATTHPPPTCTPPALTSASTLAAPSTHRSTLPLSSTRWKPRRPKRSECKPSACAGVCKPNTHVDANLSQAADRDSLHVFDATHVSDEIPRSITVHPEISAAYPECNLHSINAHPVCAAIQGNIDVHPAIMAAYPSPEHGLRSLSAHASSAAFLRKFTVQPAIVAAYPTCPQQYRVVYTTCLPHAAIHVEPALPSFCQELSADVKERSCFSAELPGTEMVAATILSAGAIMTVQEVPQDFLTQLPKDVLHRTLVFISHQTDNETIHQTFSALRLCSKTLCAASDSSRTSIILYPCHEPTIAGMLSKLSGLSSVTIYASHPREASKLNLGLVSSNVRNLSSLTLRSLCNVSMDVWEFERALLPWHHSLTFLDLHNCTLMAGACSGMSRDGPGSHTTPWIPTTTSKTSTCSKSGSHLLSWKPDLPLLTSLSLCSGSLKTLDLTSCPRLTGLGVHADKCLCTVVLSGLTSLKHATFVNNSALQVVNLSGCSRLEMLCCYSNHNLRVLSLTGCNTMQDLSCINNSSLESVDLSQCGGLQAFCCQTNSALGILDLSRCRELNALYCRGNSSLAELCLQGNDRLEKLYCSDNRFTVLDLSTCVALTALRVSCNYHLRALDVSVHRALRDVYIHGNYNLKVVDVTGCSMLRDLKCSSNQGLESVKASGCSALVSLLCQDNFEVTRLNLAGCKALKLLDVACCKKLRKVDLTSCSNLEEYVQR